MRRATASGWLIPVRHRSATATGSGAAGPIVRGGYHARPFFLASGDEFRPAPPPAFGSPEYLAALGEVRQISDTRTRGAAGDRPVLEPAAVADAGTPRGTTRRSS